MLSHSIGEIPDGSDKIGVEDDSVGGIGVCLGTFVGVFVGSVVLVDVGKLVFVGIGVVVGGGANVSQDVNTITRIEGKIALLIVFVFPHFRFGERPTMYSM
jgi:hypothetical protein